MDDSSPYTEEMIFGTESDSDHELSDESNVQDHVSAGLAVGSGKKRAAPEKSLRARLNLAKKNGSNDIFWRESRNDIS